MKSSRKFEMIDIKLIVYYLGVEVKQNEEGTFIFQENYAKEIFKKFKIHDCKPISMQWNAKSSYQNIMKLNV